MWDEEFIDLRRLLRGDYLAPPYRHRILYAGSNQDLVQALRDELAGGDCFITYCPAGWLARTFLKSDAAYAALVFDERQQPEGTGAELVAFARTLGHRERAPSFTFMPADNPKPLAETIRRALAATDSPN
ncbi:MAG TPA: hypothetical protein VF546_02430 [Pyrinomonadaceae bacterium]|jgi:hypothetical protein